MAHTIRPCALCMKEIINAGITRVHMRDELSGAVKSYDASRLTGMLDDELKRLGGSRG
jgi:deoxycytidylate deaminase